MRKSLKGHSKRVMPLDYSTQTKKKVGFVQIGENFGNQYYLPYSVGLLQAYAKTHLANYDEYSFLPPIYKREAFEKMVLVFKDVKIIFFSVYMWNFRYSLEVAKILKREYSNCLIVFGGPEVPESSIKLEIFLKKYPFIDLGCYGEGEIPFLQILRKYEGELWQDVSSIGYLNRKNLFIMNKRAERITDLDTIPSPYLEGIFEPLMLANHEESWSVMWESNRGCPFSCSYCAWGKNTKRHVFKYNWKRISDELDWFSENKIEFIFCCDANFGMFKERDLRIVEKVADNKKKYGYPKAFSVQSTKNATNTIFELQRRLNVEGLQKGVNLALQSVNKNTLASVRRSNISPLQYQELQTMFTDAGIATFSDMIIGLPEESYDSITTGISDVIQGGQHNRIQFINLAILENTEMADNEYISKFGMIIQKCKMVSHHSTISMDEKNVETQKMVVATETMPMDDWVKTMSFCWMTSLLHFNKLVQIPLILLNKKYFINYKSLIECFLSADEKYPIISQIIKLFTEKAKLIQSGDTEYIPSKEWLNIHWPADEYIFIKLCKEQNLISFYKEAKDLIGSYLENAKVSKYEIVLDDAINLNYLLIKQPFINKIKHIKANSNVLEYYQSVLIGREVSLIEGDFFYEIKQDKARWCSWQDWCREVVWYGTKKGNYLYPYCQIRTNDRADSLIASC